VATLWREGPGYASYFLAYELLMQREMAAKGIRREEIPASHTIVYGAIAGYAVRLLVLSSIVSFLLSSLSGLSLTLT
jgi:hypothetical protein